MQVRGHTRGLPTGLALSFICLFSRDGIEDSSSFLWGFVFWTYVPVVIIWAGTKDFLLSIGCSVWCLGFWAMAFVGGLGQKRARS